MIRYIPPYILKKYEERILTGELRGYVLLFDIADFTPIGTEMQRQGKQSAEELRKFLDFVFAGPIAAINRYGGFVTLFAGDSFCAVFPDAEKEDIVSAVNTITACFSDRRVYETHFGNFALHVRQTVTFGDIGWQIFENDIQNEYLFFGEPLNEISDLSGLKNELIFSDAAAQEIGEEKFEKLEKGYRLTSGKIVKKDIPLDYSYDERIKERFIRARLKNENPDNEIRSAAYCFANLEKIELEERTEALANIEKMAESYGGFVNKLDATDKGFLAFILFGMPHSEGRTLERIAGFSLEAVEINPRLALGISCGSVFAGFCGSGEVKEYTAIGHPVNLAARLMSKAREGEILTDTYLWQELQKKYKFDYLGLMTLKGIEIPIRYYRLGKRSKELADFQENRFVGREEELKCIRNNIDEAVAGKENLIVYVSGDAGIGKSRLVKEALASYPRESFHQFYVSCDAILQKPLEAVRQIVRSFFYYNPQLPREAGIQMFRGLWQGLARDDKEMIRIESVIASLLGYEWEDSVWSLLPGDEKPKQLQDAFVRFITQLCKTKPVLIHLDDQQWLDQESRLYLQTMSEKEIKPLIIISPCRYVEDGKKVDLRLANHRKYDLELSSLSEAGSNELIKTILRLPDVPDETLDLIKDRSMGNPLFIEQLTAYLMENGNIDAKGYIKGEIGYLSSFSISDIIDSRIDRLTESVKECLSNASVLGTEFDVRVLSKMLESDLRNELESGIKNRIWRYLDELRYIFTHILIKDIVYGRMMTGKLRILHLAAAEAMEKVFAGSLAENAEEIALHYEKAKLETRSARFFDIAGCFYRDKHDFHRSELNLKKGLKIREKESGPDHPDTASSLNNLAELYKIQGRYEQAEPLYLRALEIRERILGSEHPDTAQSQNNLAVLYWNRGRYEQAEPLFLRALEIREKIFGKDHSDTALSLNNLANLYVNQGRYDQAEPLFMRAQEIWKMALGEFHPYQAMTLNNLALLYNEQGRYDLAESLYLKALEIREKLPGEDHPDMAMPLNNLAALYRDRGRYDQAQPLFMRALEIREKILGAEHPETAQSINNLAALYRAQGKFEQAEPLFLRALEVWKEVLGEDHPDTATSLNNLALLYNDQERYDEAEPLYLRALQIREKVLGSEHPDTAMPLNNLAALYRVQERYEEAEPLYKRSMKIFEKVLGPEHPNTALSMNNLAALYRAQGKFDQAEPLYLKTLEILEKTIGAEHPTTAIIFYNLALLYYQQEKYDKSEPLYLKSLKILREKLGDKHPQTLKTLQGIVDLYHKTAAREKAAPYEALLNPPPPEP
jgi:tetratricopeptide (TPR) repeat protein/class 3 adenylate cyclase